MNDANPISALSRALNEKREEDRKSPKRVRFCPSCGSRRLKSYALHDSCHHCDFIFVCSGVEGVTRVLLYSEEESSATFDTLLRVSVPKSRDGIQEMLNDRNINRQTDRFATLDLDK